MPLKAPSAGIQRPERHPQSIRELRVCIVTPSLPVKEASLMEKGCLRPSRYSTEPDQSALLSMKSTPAMERDLLVSAATTPPNCGCEERAG